MEHKAPIGVLGCGSYLPAERRSNEQVSRDAGVSAEWIHSRTGVKSRRIAAPHEAASDLAQGAQPNPLLLRQVAGEFGIEPRRLVVVGEDIGNIGAACIPYALSKYASEGRFSCGDRILIASFGAGFTWGHALLTWGSSSAVRTH
ncbi:3-oxoacyl-[acyl-carrier-protein] synthase III C-terminal domain-containing protein [Streptomyces violaceusniger]|uniref:3-Oxoacyl-(Acyl-carrier-protein (ACP)) synthase III domain-containing protein n=1 Tax=Streptomyces violaceusniger (strain Tu 4113) TaxID=653045 RepID=G2PHK4_STRV4|nr:3-oxoacyl-[acyl-carrier-protein] synthase III C-terminal domain-containing protein [Streptomyces violaceusniger]AEM89007.1 3-Oxoacyl-(acyl-carrier-protein (ACP)) synthase III domain-containing protein [Streptomyces violaceusniger Tu 4113]